MEQAPQESWFYTQKGQRHGPIPFEQLKAMVNQSELDPMTDMVWKQGLPSWKPLSEVMSSFLDAGSTATHAATKPAEIQMPVSKPAEAPKPAAQPAPQPAPKPAPQPAPKKNNPSPGKSPASAKDLDWPGVKRLAYFLGAILLPMLVGGGLPFLLPLAGPAISPELGGMITLGASLLMFVLAIVLKLMRLSNLSMSRWWYFASFVPILNLWLGYRCFACPAGYAAHGKMDRSGIALAIFYWLFLLLVVASVVFALMVLTHLIANDPEFKEQLRLLIQQTKSGAAPSP